MNVANEDGVFDGDTAIVESAEYDKEKHYWVYTLKDDKDQIREGTVREMLLA